MGRRFSLENDWRMEPVEDMEKDRVTQLEMEVTSHM